MILFNRHLVSRSVRTALIFLVMCSVQLTFGFGRDGHVIVALIAYENMNERARAEVQNLLGERSMADVSSDADEERTSATGSWHYVDFELSDGKEKAEEIPKTNILEAIDRDTSIVANLQETSQSRNQALRNLIHWLGDMHQPCHCSDNNDQGGNLVFINYFGTTETLGRRRARLQLHSLWDTQILRRSMETLQTTNTEFARELSKKFALYRTEICAGDPTSWALEGFRYAGKIVYGMLPSPTGDPLKGGYYEIRENYNSVAEGLLHRQLAAGGFRLAAILNSIWP